MPPGLTIPSIFTAIDRFSAPLRGMGGAMGSFVNRSQVGLAKVERGFRRIMSPITNLQNMLRGVGLYIGLFSAILLMKNAVGIMADFEQAQINIASVTEKNSIPYLKSLALEARRVAVQYGQSASAISDFQFELVKMGYGARDVLKMTEPITTGAVALRTTPNRLQEVVGAVLKSHDMPVTNAATGENNAQKVVNQFAYVANATAAQFEDLSSMLPIINRLTHKMNISFPQALAVLGQLRNVQIHTSTGATSFKNILLDLKADSWEDLRKGMEKILKARNQTAYTFNKFGKRSVISAIEIASMFDYIEKLAKQTENVDSAYTNMLAGKQLDSIKGKINLFKASYRELVLSIDDGRGPLGTALKQYIDVGSAMLLITSDSEAARYKLAQMDTTVIELAHKYLRWLKIIGYVTAAFIALKIVLIAWNVVLIASRILMFAWSVALGVATALGWANVAAVRGNIVAITVLRGLIYLATAAQWLWNVAMTANPIGLIIVGIAALVTWIAIVITKWDEWGAAASLTLGPFAVVLNMVMLIANHWDHISSAFTNGGVLVGIKAIGKAILDCILYPVQQIYELLSKIPGIGRQMGAMAKIIEINRNALWDTPSMASPGSEPKKQIIGNRFFDPSAEDYGSMLQKVGVSVDINNNSGFPVKARSEGAKIIMNPQSTFDF